MAPRSSPRRICDLCWEPLDPRQKLFGWVTPWGLVLELGEDCYDHLTSAYWIRASTRRPLSDHEMEPLKW